MQGYITASIKYKVLMIIQVWICNHTHQDLVLVVQVRPDLHFNNASHIYCLRNICIRVALALHWILRAANTVSGTIVNSTKWLNKGLRQPLSQRVRKWLGNVGTRTGPRVYATSNAWSHYKPYLLNSWRTPPQAINNTASRQALSNRLKSLEIC